MAKTITLDRVDVLRLQLTKDTNGDLLVYAEYELKSGNTVIQSKSQEITKRVSGARKAAALGALDAIAQELAADELA